MTRLLAALIVLPVCTAAAEPPRDWCVLPDDPAAGLFVPNLWTDGIVPYHFDFAVTAENQTRMLEAMCSIEHVCGVRFKKWQGEASYVYIENSDKDYNYSSKVGMGEGRQDLNILNWDHHYVIVHELMHVLGAWHEQQRPDRDAYVEILEDNIEEGHAPQFEYKAGQWVGAYDFDSLMHYRACAFSKCESCDPLNHDCTTIKVRPPYYNAWQTHIGQRDHMSDGDKAMLAYLYAPADAPWAYTVTINPSDPEPKHYFGFSVAADNGRTFAGAPGQDFVDEFANDAAYLFDSGGVQLAKFEELGSEGDSYGRSVAIEGDWAYVGVPPHGWNFYGDYGSVWIYDLTGQQIPNVIGLPDVEAYKGYGHAVDVHGDRLVVAAPLYNTVDYIPFIDWGAAYIYDAETYVKIAKVIPSDEADEYNFFGSDVATDGDYVVVGAQSADGNAVDTGAVYVYDADSGAELAKLTASDGASYDAFGLAVDVEDGVAVVGAIHNTHNGVHKSGAAYVFDLASGQQLMKLSTSDAHVNQYFGRSVSISNGRVIIGATGDNETGFGAGAAYVFDLATGEQLMKLIHPCGVGNDLASFGFSVAADGDSFVVGAFAENDLAGSVYRFEPPVEPCLADFNGDGSISILDFLAFQTAWKNHVPGADCNNDQLWNILDFVCFKELVTAGCD